MTKPQVGGLIRIIDMRVGGSERRQSAEAVRDLRAVRLQRRAALKEKAK